MSALNFIVIAVLVLTFSAFILRLLYIISCNVITGRKFYLSLEKEFDRLRLSRMLSALGINKSQYIHQTSTFAIKQQMQSCDTCDNTDECDATLSPGVSSNNIDIDAINFCKNEAALKEIRQNQSKVQAAK